MMYFGQIAGILKGSEKRVGSDRAGALLSQDNFFDLDFNLGCYLSD